MKHKGYGNSPFSCLSRKSLMQYAMGNSITIEDTNGNRKLLKKRYEAKIDNVSAMMDAFVAYKRGIMFFD
jgi:phage terminase large subunit-like protein